MPRRKRTPKTAAHGPMDQERIDIRMDEEPFNRSKIGIVECVRITCARFSVTPDQIVQHLIADARRNLKPGDVFEIRKSFDRLLPDSLHADYGLAWYTNPDIQRRHAGFEGNAVRPVAEAELDIVGGYYSLGIASVPHVLGKSKQKFSRRITVAEYGYSVPSPTKPRKPKAKRKQR